VIGVSAFAISGLPLGPVAFAQAQNSPQFAQDATNPAQPDAESDGQASPPSPDTPPDTLPDTRPETPFDLRPAPQDPDSLVIPDNPFESIDPLKKPPAPLSDGVPSSEADDDAVTNTHTNTDTNTGPDYSHLSPAAERTARLNALFEKLAAETRAEDADLIAEEIWAIWLDSGSASVNFILRRGTAAQKAGDMRLARRLYDQVTLIAPDYAEGWSRSGRLAIEEEDMGRALADVTEALIREPRHFYALWTLGNIFEHLGRQNDALEVYGDANRLYPELEAVKDRIERMRNSVEGDVL